MPADRSTNISLQELRLRLTDLGARHVGVADAGFIADKIVMAERMNIPTHGLHYFLHSLWPHLLDRRLNEGAITVRGNAVYSAGTGGVGMVHLHQCLSQASTLARRDGVAVAVLHMPGKVGALRVFCPEFMEAGQLVLMVKNTARTVGLAEIKEPVFGTNPLCIGLPGTRFIYDSSVATVATNKIRLAQKTGQVFPAEIGVDQHMHPTADPRATIEAGGFLLPFSDGPYWFKSFFLGVAIEAMAALAGGNTSSRVGDHTGKRLHSREGMVAILVDRAAFPDYDAYAEEVGLFLAELASLGLRIPGDYDPERPTADVLTADWEEIRRL